jgi:hypothetical protein
MDARIAGRALRERGDRFAVRLRNIEEIRIGWSDRRLTSTVEHPLTRRTNDPMFIDLSTGCRHKS